jgi:hypothetical protein
MAGSEVGHPGARMRRLVTAAASAFALSLSPGAARAADTPVWGVTVDRTSHLSETLAALQALPERPTTRIYYAASEAASRYTSAVEQLGRVSNLMGELLDSSEEKKVSVSAFQTRVSSYISALGATSEIWEIGNEVNGNWTGSYAAVSERLTEAYDDVAAAGGRTALTLYANNFGPENCGDGTSELTPLQFTQQYVPARVAEGLDYVLLSYYPTQCGGREPSSLEVALAFEALHTLYPHAKLGFGEVGLPRNATKRTTAQAAQIMRWAYSLNPGLSYYVGGYFWWYAEEDSLRAKGSLRSCLQEAFTLEAGALGGVP